MFLLAEHPRINLNFPDGGLVSLMPLETYTTSL